MDSMMESFTPFDISSGSASLKREIADTPRASAIRATISPRGHALLEHAFLRSLTLTPLASARPTQPLYLSLDRAFTLLQNSSDSYL